jgi:hypothetical protein
MTRLLLKKRSIREADGNDESVAKKLKIEADSSPQPRFHFEFEENEDVPPLSPMPAKLVNKR